MKTISFSVSTLLVFITCFCLNVSGQLCINSDTKTIICDNLAPIALPLNVTSVYINIFSADIDFNVTSFSHKSWRTVTLLDITAHHKDKYSNISVTFGSMCFSQIKALKQLKIHGNQIKDFSVGSFDGVEHLQELLVSSYLDINDVIVALRAVDITVETLFFNDIINDAEEEILCLDDSFFDLLRSMSVTGLSLRNSIVKLNHLQHGQFDSKHINTLDISNTQTMLPNMFEAQIFDIYVSIFEGLKTLNISSGPVLFDLPGKDFLNNKIMRTCDELLGSRLLKIFFLSVENLYSNTLVRDTVVTNNSVLDISHCNFRLKTLHFRENKLQYLNISVYLPQKNMLREVDLSNNEIKYLSPLVLRTAKSLEILKLASNELFHMEFSSEFKDVLTTLTDLRHFSIADNNISNLPRDMFINNAALEVIDLAENKLQSITFTLKHLEKLKSLNIARNRIQFIESKELGDIQLLFKTRASAGSDETTVIEMNGNPLICSCESVEFMEWIISFVHIHNIKQSCLMENEEKEINKDSLAALKLLCHRTTIILGACAGILVLFIGTLLLIKLILRRKQRQKDYCKRKLFLKHFRRGILRERFLCQISYSGEDEECFLDIIYPNFSTVLRKMVRCKKNVICTGDRNFCLGRPIVDEMIRCISKSCVVIFVISKSFCRSRWCLLELREAYEMGKPIILILKEEVNTKIMPKLLLTIFNRLTRAKLVENGGKYKLIPDWETLGESTIKLAAENYAEHKNNIPVVVTNEKY